MGKRIFVFLLAVVLLVGALPVAGFAQEQTQPTETVPTETTPPQTQPTPQPTVPSTPAEALKQAALDSYTKTQQSTGMQSLNGYCGKMASHQLVHMGINTGLLSNHGNKQYDMYEKMRKTSAGKYISAYPAEDYTLEDALNILSENGTKPVYNILVGFEWTNTKAGNKYGHVCVINGILDGKVYFMESFKTRFAPEGKVNICTIKEFADFYKTWTQFEGVIYFADSFMESNRQYGTDLYVTARFPMTMRSVPTLVGDEECKVLRTVAAGEQLRVTQVLVNPRGEQYYLVKEKNRTGYIVAQGTVLTRTNGEDITLKNLKMKSPMKVGAKEPLTGAISAENGLVGAVEVVVRNAEGTEVARKREITDCKKVVLSSFSRNMFSTLAEGRYTVTITADTAAACIRSGKLDYSYKTVLLAEKSFWVGAVGEEPAAEEAQAEVKDGWYWVQKKKKWVWYCYDNGKPRTGWYEEAGLRYYLKADGEATIGKAKIEGKTYYFSDRGVLITGWLRIGSRMRYYGKDGAFLTGWQTIDNSKYFFNSKGYRISSGARKDGEVRYKFLSDGRATPIS